jgi:hypothetical protein
MTKPTKSSPEPTTNVVPLAGHQPLPAALTDHLARDAGKGVSDKAEDQLIPIVYVLQTNSPACDKRAPTYIDGAEPGGFWLKGAIEPVRDGVAGIVVIPCAMTRTWMEWLPGRQGFAARHDKPPADLESGTGEGGRQALTRPNGNVIQDTREFYLLVDGQPYLLPCYATKHTFARGWQTHFRQFKHPKTGGVLPSFARKYRVTTVPTMNAMGRWFGLKFTDLNEWVSADEYQAAKALNAIVEQGRQRIEMPIADDADLAPAPVSPAS